MSLWETRVGRFFCGLVGHVENPYEVGCSLITGRAESWCKRCWGRHEIPFNHLPEHLQKLAVDLNAHNLERKP